MRLIQDSRHATPLRRGPRPPLARTFQANACNWENYEPRPCSIKITKGRLRRPSRRAPRRCWPGNLSPVPAPERCRSEDRIPRRQGEQVAIASDKIIRLSCQQSAQVRQERQANDSAETPCRRPSVTLVSLAKPACGGRLAVQFLAAGAGALPSSVSFNRPNLAGLLTGDDRCLQLLIKRFGQDAVFTGVGTRRARLCSIKIGIV